MASLKATLSEVRSRIEKYKSRRLNEENTKAALIDPVLRALGWNLEDLEEVQREYKVKRKDRPMDYVLFCDREPVLIVEAKALREDAGNRRWADQVVGYAATAGIPWALLTNGAEYRIYNALAPVHVDRKLFRSAKVVEEPQKSFELLSLLHKSKMGERDLDLLWRAQYVDQEVRRAMEKLFALGAPDASVIPLVEKKTKDLDANDIRASLARMRMDLDFPQMIKVREEDKGNRKKPNSVLESAATPKAQPVSIQDLIRVGLIKPPLDLEKEYKGIMLTARIEADGTVTFDGASYDSLSTAGGMARKSVIGAPPGKDYPATNGWTFWEFRGADGELAVIDRLRREFPGENRLKIVG